MYTAHPEIWDWVKFFGKFVDVLFAVVGANEMFSAPLRFRQIVQIVLIAALEFQQIKWNVIVDATFEFSMEIYFRNAKRSTSHFMLIKVSNEKTLLCFHPTLLRSLFSRTCPIHTHSFTPLHDTIKLMIFSGADQNVESLLLSASHQSH